MNRDLVTGAIATVVVAVVAMVLLQLAGQGALPTGFGLFDMSSDAVRAVVFIVLVVLAGLLWLVYSRRGEQPS